MTYPYHPDDEAIGARAKRRREELGLTVDQVAAQLRVCRSAIYMREMHGVSTLPKAREWAAVLNMTLMDLLFGRREDV